MDTLYILCVILCFATIAAALPESDDTKWRAHMEERMEEMLQMMQRQNEVIEKQTNTIKKQSVEIEKLRHRVKTLEKKPNNSRTSNDKVIYESTGHGNVTLSIEKELHSEGMVLKYVESLVFI